LFRPGCGCLTLASALGLAVLAAMMWAWLL